MVWYSHFIQNFPQFIVIHTVKGFGILNKAETDVFLELPCFFEDPVDVGNLISVSSAFSKTSLNSLKMPPELLKLINEYSKVQDIKLIHRNSLHHYILTMENQKETLRKQSHSPLQQKV